MKAHGNLQIVTLLLRSACAVAAVAVLGLLLASGGGVVVILRNSSSETLSEVAVHYTGGFTPPQEIAAGTSATVRPAPIGESSLEVHYRSGGSTQICRLDTYLETGYEAYFEIELTDNSCRVVKKEVEI